MKKLFITFLLSYVSTGYATTVYYDIDFSSPLHQIGMAPTVSGAIDTPSQMNFGTPIVRESLGALDDQPLVFDMNQAAPFFYDEIILDINQANNFYYSSFDIITVRFRRTPSCKVL